MARQRFVAPTTVRLDLTDGDWIEVKERLAFGEAQALTASTLAQTGSLMNGETPDIRLDLGVYKVMRMVFYLTDWSFRGPEGEAVSVSRATIAALDPATADEIDSAIDAHLEALAANPTAPMPTSSSP